jgi:hypothetical protein
LNDSSCKKSTCGEALEGDRGGLIISDPNGRDGIGTFKRFRFDVGERIGRGEAGGDNGAPKKLVPVKKGRGAAATSSSRVTLDAVGEPRDETLDNVGLDIRAPVVTSTEIFGRNVKLPTSTSQHYQAPYELLRRLKFEPLGE